MDALHIGAIGMQAQQTQIDAIAHNVANVNTPGFRRERVSFSTVAATLEANGAADPALALSNAMRGAGVLAEVGHAMNPGELKQTGQPLDLAVDGAGWIEVLRPDGTPAYTRTGTLKVDADGNLALSSGEVLAGRIAIAPDARAIRIESDGRVWVESAGDGAPLEAGRIDLVHFANPEGLRAVGGNLFVADESAGSPQALDASANGALRQGYLESSNVEMIDELVQLMLAQRAFEMNSRVVQAADQMLSITNGLVR
jgi:flagellar basal-body rod protein FlgG